MNYKIWLLGHNTKHFLDMTWFRIKTIEDETWLGLVITTTWILLAIGYSN